ncbi:MAG: flagellar capping protein FliD [Pirellulaceae bacterium]|jgi:flagellar capping protein FliD
MGRITSSVGLITGVPIVDTVDQLIALKARPRDLLAQSVSKLEQKQVAISDLTARVLGVQFSAKAFATDSLFTRTKSSVSNEALLSVSNNGTPKAGSYQFTPVRQASTQQLLSTGFSSTTGAVGAGTLSLRRGGEVDRGIGLDLLNGGAGIQRGEIKITDRSGASAVINLSFSKTIDDVLDAINSADDIDITASASGDGIRLTDNSGATVANLRVQEVGAGSTAADLGLASINTANSAATGDDVLELFEQLTLGSLNDFGGLSIRGALPDLEITFQDGSTALQIDLHRAGEYGNATATTTSSNGADAEFTIAANATGGDLDEVKIVFKHIPGLEAGEETVEYDDSDSDNKQLIISIESGVTTANDVINAINNDNTVEDLFTASVGGGDGSGIVGLTDTATTTGGVIVEAGNEQNIGDLLRTINEADPARLRAEISADGDRIQLVDLTTGGGTFSVTSPLGGELAEDLGFTGTAVGGVISGRRLYGGLKTSLLSSLNGGQGFGTLGSIQITDRAGTATGAIDLSAAETLDDIIDAVNASAANVVARVNDARNGIEIRDASGGSSNLIVESLDANNTSDVLGITVDADVTSVISSSLNLQTVGENTLLADLNHGKGVDDGTILIRDSSSGVGSVSLSQGGYTTLGEVIDAINGLSTVNVEARINDSGDGIVIVDQAFGTGTLSVAEVGSGTTAADLNILGNGTTIDIGGTPTQVLDGSNATTIDLDSDDSLEDLVAKINSLDVGITASIFSDGTGITPHRLSIVSNVLGEAGEFFIDTSGISFGIQEVAKGRDALALFGPPDSGAAILASSKTNTFENLVDGLSVTLSGSSNEVVTVTVDESTDSLVSSLQLFVDQYNQLRDGLDEQTFFDSNTGDTGSLFGSIEALRLDIDLPRLLTGRFFNSGSIRSLESIGVSIGDTGKLSFNSTEFLSTYNADPDGVEEFFTNEETGFAKRIDDLAEALAGEGNSLLLGRLSTIQSSLDLQFERIVDLNEQLEVERNLLLNEFFDMESTIARLQSSLNSISSIQSFPPL